MKRAGTAALTISLALLLCACGSAGTEQRIEARRGELAAAETLSFTAELTANLAEEAFAFSLACSESGGVLSAEVLSPASIAGIRFRMEDAGSVMEYETVSFTLGDAAGYPLTFLPVLTEALRSGHIVRCWSEHGHLAAELYVGEERSLTVWYAEETMNPAFASLSESGVERVRCHITAFQTEGTILKQERITDETGYQTNLGGNFS